MDDDNKNISINIASASNRWFEIIATLLLCGAIGLVGYSLAQKGWVEIAATMVTMFLFQFIRMLINNGLMVLPDRFGSNSEGREGEVDFAETRGALKVAFLEFQQWQKNSPVWRLCMLAIGYAVAFMFFRWVVSIALTVFSNQWIAGAAAALLGAIIIAPGFLLNAFRGLGSKRAAAREEKASDA